MNLADVVQQHARSRPDATAVVEPRGAGGERVATSWRELDKAVDAAAAHYGAWGLRAPQRVLLHGENSLALVVGHLACLRTGLVSTPTNPQSTTTELRHLAEVTGASLLLTDDTVSQLRPLVEDGLLVRPLTDLLQPLTEEQAPAAAPVDPEALAVLIQTSGSLSQPQGVMLSHRSVATASRQVAEVGALGPDSVMLAMLPLFHVFGLNGVLGAALTAGATTVLVPGMQPDLVKVLAREGVTEVALTPTVLSRLLRVPDVATGLSGLSRVVSGAAPLSTALAREFTRLTGVRVDQAYGLTEAGPGVASTVGGPGLLSGTHVGTPLPGVEVRVGKGREPGEPGEVEVRGPNLFSGYWPDGHGGPGADGWFATGDLGYLSDGQLYLVGRLREVVIVSGFNVYPAEVEEALMRHPAVHAAAVIGHADEQTGESLVAFVSVAPGFTGLSMGDLRRHCEASLARYKCPGEIYVLERMPRSITGKIRKSELRELVDVLEEEQ